MTLGVATLLWAVLASSSTVLNPETNRPVKVHGPTFNALLQSGFVYHEQSMHPIQPNRYREPILSDDWSEIIITNRSWPHDGQLLFVEKPSGLLTVPGREQPDCLITRVQSKYPSAKVCHRLDRDTSGVVVLALDPQIHAQLSKLFETRKTEKIYTALVAGHVLEDQGIVDLPIGKEATKEGYSRWVIGGTQAREAQTEWNVDRRFQLDDGFCYSRVILKPLTGRGQQIRLHMKALGHALLGDTLHAPPEIATSTPRLCLHATSLGFRLDTTNNDDDDSWIQASVPPPF